MNGLVIIFMLCLFQADTISLAKQVSEQQAKINDVTRKTKAIISELCMYQVSIVHCHVCTLLIPTRHRPCSCSKKYRRKSLSWLKQMSD